MTPQPVSGASPPLPATATPSPLLERFRLAARARGDSQPVTDTLVSWARAFILFHNKRHPSELGLLAVSHFLEHVVKTTPEPPPALAQARAALTFLYGQVLEIDLGRRRAVRARRGQRLPVVLAPEQVRLVLAQVHGGDGLFRLMSRLLYGCGLRVTECCRLRVHDLDLERGQILVR